MATQSKPDTWIYDCAVRIRVCLEDETISHRTFRTWMAGIVDDLLAYAITHEAPTPEQIQASEADARAAHQWTFYDGPEPL